MVRSPQQSGPVESSMSVCGRGGGGFEGVGVWDPKVCVPKKARPDCPNGKFRVLPRWSLGGGGGGAGGGTPAPPTMHGHSNPFPGGVGSAAYPPSQPLPSAQKAG